MLADFTVFDRDLYALKPDEIRSAQVEMTVMDGKVRYQRVQS